MSQAGRFFFAATVDAILALFVFAVRGAFAAGSESAAAFLLDIPEVPVLLIFAVGAFSFVSAVFTLERSGLATLEGVFSFDTAVAV